MAAFRYVFADVFTDTPLEGEPDLVSVCGNASRGLLYLTVKSAYIPAA